MKKISVLLVTVLFIASCTNTGTKTISKKDYTVTGSIDTTIDGWAYLQKRAEGTLKTIDSVRLTGGKFEFKGAVDFPEVYFINIPTTKSLVPFFVEPADITINIDAKDINKSKILGSVSQKEYEGYLDMLDQYDLKIRESYTLYQKAEELKDQAQMRKEDSVMNEYYNQKDAFIRKFAIQKNKSVITPYIVLRNSYLFELPQLDSIMSNFDTTLRRSPYMPSLNEFLNTLKRTAIGMPYVTFMMQDTSGVYFPVADMIGGKYVLIDFWASWCGPCRAENPNLVKIYNEFKNKGFAIVGVSFDTKRENWLKAIKDDKLAWKHVSDLKGWENAAGKVYGIRSIPSNVLIDKEGKIIAKNLRGEDLRKKLEEIFKSNV
jgi:thiol-disulfide isomerase/thioredoxin